MRFIYRRYIGRSVECTCASHPPYHHPVRMSLPCELRTICHLLSTTEPPQLPYITPTLLRNLFSCGDLLSADHGNVKAADASESLVLVHKFKIQITTLLTGKESGGRFAAVLLIKAVVELGGWEILKGSEPWVRGLLQVLVGAFSSCFFGPYTKDFVEIRCSSSQELVYTDTCEHLYYDTSVSNPRP